VRFMIWEGKDGYLLAILPDHENRIPERMLVGRMALAGCRYSQMNPDTGTREVSVETTAARGMRPLRRRQHGECVR
jgi:hypothetical protein